MEFKLDQKIKHKTFGIGTIIKIINEDTNDPILWITFNNDYCKHREFTKESIQGHLLDLE